MRPIEHADVAGLREAPVDPPQEVVREFFVGGLLERRQHHPLRVDGSHDVADDAALARGVHRLQHEKHRGVRRVVAALREQAFLQQRMLTV